MQTPWEFASKHTLTERNLNNLFVGVHCSNYKSTEDNGRKTYWNNEKYYFEDIPLVCRCPHLTKRPLCGRPLWG